MARLFAEAAPAWRSLALLLVVAAGFHAGLVARPMDEVLYRLLGDDAFYYFALVDNVLAGKGIVFNEGVPTNGFHPLYAMLLLPVFAVLGALGPDAPVYGALALVALAHVATGVVVARIAARLAGPTAGVVAAAVWLLSPTVLFTTLMGLETPLQALGLALVVDRLVRWDLDEPLARQRALGLGLLLGLTFLARMDAVLFVVGILAVLWLRRARGAHRRGPARWLPTDLLTVGTTALAVVTPWLAWSKLATGHLTPVSGAALRAIRLEHRTRTELTLNAIERTERFAAELFAYPVTGTPLQHLVPVVALGLPAAWLLARRDPMPRQLISRLDFLWAGAALYFAFYWFVQLGFREWYGMTTFLFVALVFGPLVARAGEGVRHERLGRQALAVSLALLFALGGVAHAIEGNFPQERLKREVARYLTDELPPGARVGAFNTGVYQYYTPQRDVINLDGVMNPESLEAIEAGELDAYALALGITHIVDPPVHAYRLLGDEVELQPLSSFQQERFTFRSGWRTTEYVLYAVRAVDAQ